MIRKMGARILFVCLIVMTFGCGAFNTDVKDVKEENVGTEDKNKIQDMQANLISEGGRRCRYYNNYYYGTKAYQLMVWEKGKGCA